MNEETASPPARFARWMFTDRSTGRIVVAQMPNAALWIVLAAAAAKAVVPTGGTAIRTLNTIESAALGWWALDEILRGVNPWRRLLGIAALAYVVRANLR